AREDISQRHLAEHMGIALGLANAYLKRCAKKGWIKINTAPANRYLYYLTPTGFAEKAKLTAEFLSTSLTLFREARADYQSLFAYCREQQIEEVSFFGQSDLTEIAYLRSMEAGIKVKNIGCDDGSQPGLLDLAITTNKQDLSSVVVVTLLENDDAGFQALRDFAAANERQLLVPEFLLRLNPSQIENVA
ncbi:MAG: winged helix-turn-helix transcriptional regulator, partial [Pseudomonadota bacterium]